MSSDFIPTLFKIILAILLIYFLVRKIRKKIKQRKATTSYRPEKINKHSGSTFAEKSKENLPLLFLQEDIDQITEQNKQTKLSLNYEERKMKREQFKNIIQDRRTKRLEELGYSNEDNFDEFASKTLMNEVLNTMVDLIETKVIESG